MDDTVIGGNSLRQFGLSELKQGHISPQHFFVGCGRLFLYKLNILDIEKAYAATVIPYKGMVEKDVEIRARDFAEKNLVTCVFKEAQKTIEHHRSQGHKLVMATNSSVHLAEAVGDALGFDAVIGNEFPSDQNGKLLGTFAKPLCTKAGKLARVATWAKGAGVDLRTSYFYSDSYSDINLFEAVGHPVAINADPKLKSHAVKNRWQTARWSEKI